eukprot:13774479-Alexandrium_andersonii.AAC.1
MAVNGAGVGLNMLLERSLDLAMPCCLSETGSTTNRHRLIREGAASMSRPALRVEGFAAKLVGLATGVTSTVVVRASQGLGMSRNCGLAMPSGA